MGDVTICCTKDIGASAYHSIGEAGIQCLVVPAIAIIDDYDINELLEILQGPDLLIISSSRAFDVLLRAGVGPMLVGRDVAVVGDETSASCERHGMHVVTTTHNVAELSKAISPFDCPMTHFCGGLGKERGLVVPGARPVVIYDTVLLKPVLQHAVSGTLFFSPSGVDSLMFANPRDHLGDCFAFGPTTTQALRTYGVEPTHSAPTPHIEQFIRDVLMHYRSSTHAQ